MIRLSVPAIGPLRRVRHVHRTQADDGRRVPPLGRGQGRALGAARRRAGDDVAGARASHAETKGEAYVALRDALRARTGCDVEVYRRWRGDPDRRADDLRTGWLRDRLRSPATR